MNKKIILTIVLGTLALFIWNAISWMALPFHTNTLNEMPVEAMDLEVLKNGLPKDGIYHYPGPPETGTAEEMAEIESKLEAGPRITFMMVKRGPTVFFDPASFIKSLLINLLTCMAFIYVLRKIGIKSISQVLTVSVVVALIVSLASDIQLMNWYLFPTDYTMANVVDHVVAFTLMGLIAYAFRPKDAAVSS